MVRKTKKEAEATRQSIINAAREVFSEKGVSRTSLDQIAKHAGVTRGAVYWHFENKAALFHAMREQVCLPLIDRMDDALPTAFNAQSPDPLTVLENMMLDTIQQLNDDLATRQTYEIMMSKCEYVEEFSIVLQQILDNCHHIADKYAALYREAIRLKLVNADSDPLVLAADTHLFFGGLLHYWIKDKEHNHLPDQANSLIKNHIQLKRLTA